MSPGMSFDLLLLIMKLSCILCAQRGLEFCVVLKLFQCLLLLPTLLTGPLLDSSKPSSSSWSSRLGFWSKSFFLEIPLVFYFFSLWWPVQLPDLAFALADYLLKNACIFCHFAIIWSWLIEGCSSDTSGSSNILQNCDNLHLTLHRPKQNDCCLPRCNAC